MSECMKKTGQVTIPTNLDIVPETIEILKRWGADAIRDCDGTEFPEDLTPYKMIVHCGACMLNEREMKYRQAWAKDQKIAITNYGILIAHVHGILKRSVEPFPAIAELLD